MNLSGNPINLNISAKAISSTLGIRKYFTIFIVLSIILTALYIIILPMLPFGAFFLGAVSFITPLQIFFSISMGLMFSVLVTISMRSHSFGSAIEKKTGLTSVFSSVVNLFCCTPILPTLFGFIGAVVPFFGGYSTPLQYFFATEYPIFYALSIFLILYAILKTSSNLGCCLPFKNKGGTGNINKIG